MRIRVHAYTGRLEEAVLGAARGGDGVVERAHAGTEAAEQAARLPDAHVDASAEQQAARVEQVQVGPTERELALHKNELAWRDCLPGYWRGGGGGKGRRTVRARALRCLRETAKTARQSLAESGRSQSAIGNVTHSCHLGHVIIVSFVSSSAGWHSGSTPEYSPRRTYTLPISAHGSCIAMFTPTCTRAHRTLLLQLQPQLLYFSNH